MSTNIHHIETASIATITQPESTIARGLVSINIHTTNSPSDQAAYECYEDLLLSGTTKKNRAELLHAINALGAHINISVEKGVLTIEMSSLASAWDKTLTLVKELLTESTFTTDELKRVKQLATNELHDAKEDAKTIAHHALINSLYPKTDSRNTADITKLQKEIKKVSQKDIKRVHSRLQQRHWVASVTGSEAVCTQFNKLVTTLTKANKPKGEINVTVTKKTTRLLTTNISSRQNVDLSIGCAIPLKPSDDDYPAVVFAIAVLAKTGGFAGRLMSTVREKEGLTYGIYGRLTGYGADTNGYLWIMTFFSPNQLQQGITSTFREIRAFSSKGITSKEFASFTTILETGRVLQNDSPLTQLAALHHYNQLGFTTEQIDAYHASFNSLTKAQVNQAIKKYFNPDALTISAAGPVTSVLKTLKKLTATV